MWPHVQVSNFSLVGWTKFETDLQNSVLYDSGSTLRPRPKFSNIYRCSELDSRWEYEGLTGDLELTCAFCICATPAIEGNGSFVSVTFPSHPLLRGVTADASDLGC